MKVKEESEKVGLKLNIQKTKIMASGSIQFSSVASRVRLCNPMNHSTPGLPVHHQLPEITCSQTDGETMETVTDYFGGLQNHYRWCMQPRNKKKHLLLGRKAMTNLDSILKSRNITLLTKVCLVKALVFPVVMYGCESWTVKKAEHWRIDAFELWCWRRLLRIPWTARRSNQSILKEISPEYSLEGLMLKLKL